MTLEEFAWFYNETRCFFHGGELVHARLAGGADPSRIWTLDRLDTSKGYDADNVAVCCQRCNMTKNTHTPETWRACVDGLTAYFGSRP